MNSAPIRLRLVGAISLALGSIAAMPVAAQSNVTVFGIVDSAARYVSNEGRGNVSSLVSGANSTSRLGFRGTEDLGGGLSAGFHLEHGISLDTGSAVSATQFWDRRATVSLISKSLGEIRAGRDFVPSYLSWSRYDPFSYVGVAGANNFISNAPTGPIRSAYGTGVNTTVRSSNAVQLLLPRGLGGLEGGLMVAAGEGGTAAAGQHKLVGVRLGYVSPRFAVSAAHTRTENNLTVLGTHKDSVVGGLVNIDRISLTAAYRQFEYGQSKQNNLLVGAIFPVGKTGQIKASLNRVDLDGRVGATVVDANDATQLGLGYVHNLSKRTALYVNASRIDNKGAATFVVPGGPAGLAGGNHSTGYEAGLRHIF